MTRVANTAPLSGANATGANRPSNAADRFLENAKKFMGRPYLWGGGHGANTGVQNVDCSGLVLQAARMTGGINLDGTAAMQQRMGQPVSMNNLKPGDLVFKGNPAYHVGIFIGNGQVLHAPKTGDVVRVTSVSGWESARRVFDEGGAPLDVSDVGPPPPSPSGGSAGPSAGPSGGPSGGGMSVGGGGSPSSLSLPSQGNAINQMLMRQGEEEAERQSQASGRPSAVPKGKHSGLQNVNSTSPGNMGALLAKLEGMGVSKEFLQGLSEEYGVPLEMILAVIQQESGGNPNARSPVGAQGLMQLMPATAAGLGVNNPMDPKQNIEGGVKYLAQQLKAFDGDPKLALAAYNAGPGNVQKYNGVPPFAETQKYVANITNMMGLA